MRRSEFPLSLLLCLCFPFLCFHLVFFLLKREFLLTFSVAISFLDLVTLEIGSTLCRDLGWEMDCEVYQYGILANPLGHYS